MISSTAIELVAVSVGLPKDVPWQGRDVYSGIHKIPVTEPLFLSKVNLAGDAQGDLINHGGPDKAVNVYCYEHYPYWEQLTRQSLPLSAFGENITLCGLTEKDVCIGDTFRWGEALVQVCQPRRPCFKVSMRFGIEDLFLKIIENGYSGYYLRVLEEGQVGVDQPFELVERGPYGITVAQVNYVTYHYKENVEMLREVMAKTPELAVKWRGMLERGLAEVEG